MQNEHIEIELPAAMVVGIAKERRCAVQIDYLLLAIIVSPLVFGGLLAYVNRGHVAHLPSANDSTCTQNDEDAFTRNGKNHYSGLWNNNRGWGHNWD